mmetsp:Transcript_120833/g.336476  ORF Transcript_120833/g.336476 Transcript_120833/m.336476 type:complete len:301 (-) Transcript_120833:335-1237(-)
MADGRRDGHLGVRQRCGLDDLLPHGRAVQVGFRRGEPLQVHARRELGVQQRQPVQLPHRLLRHLHLPRLRPERVATPYRQAVGRPPRGARHGADGGVREDLLHPRGGDPKRLGGGRAAPRQLVGPALAHRLLPLRRLARVPRPRRRHGAAAVHPQHRLLRRLGQQGLGRLAHVHPDGARLQRDRDEEQVAHRSRGGAVQGRGPVGGVRPSRRLLHAVHRRRGGGVRDLRGVAGDRVLQHLLVQGLHLDAASRLLRCLGEARIESSPRQRWSRPCGRATTAKFDPGRAREAAHYRMRLLNS